MQVQHYNQTINEIMKYQYRQFIDPQNGPIREFVTRITHHKHKKGISDIIFIFSQYCYPYQIKTCTLQDLDPTNAFLYPTNPIKIANFSLSSVLEHHRQEKPEYRPLQHSTFMLCIYSSPLQLQHQGKMKIYMLYCVIFQFYICATIKIRPELQRNILNFGYGINYKYEGMVAHSFDRFYVVRKIYATYHRRFKIFQIRF